MQGGRNDVEDSEFIELFNDCKNVFDQMSI